MAFFSSKKPERKSREYKELYRQEFDKQKATALRKKIREDVRRDLTPPKTRKEKIIETTGGAVGKKDKLFKNIGGGINIRKDALSKLKRLGKG